MSEPKSDPVRLAAEARHPPPQWWLSETADLESLILTDSNQSRAAIKEAALTISTWRTQPTGRVGSSNREGASVTYHYGVMSTQITTAELLKGDLSHHSPPMAQNLWVTLFPMLARPSRPSSWSQSPPSPPRGRIK